MARRSKRSFPMPAAAVKWLLVFNLALGGFVACWYLVQPETRRGEVRQLVRNAFERDKRVSLVDVAWDIWQLYYATGGKAGLAPGDKSIVYGGLPRTLHDAPGAAGVRVLMNEGYVVGYSDAYGNPLWAAYHVRDLGSLPRPAARPEKFEVDRRTAARVKSDEYANSGYDRGHMAPNYAIATRYGTKAQRETFLMSNITPQLHSLNAGLWRELEMKIATSYPARYEEVWVLTGPVFGSQPKRLRGGVVVPDAFFLIVIDESEGRLRTLSFIIPQEAPTTAEPATFLTSIEEIQRRTGLDFLSELEDTAEREVEQAKATRVW